MKHEHRFRKLGRSPEHRKDLLRTMLAQLILNEQIMTTAPKAKEVAKRAEKVGLRLDVMKMNRCF
jgi:large subunit ribosomal protein L17